MKSLRGGKEGLETEREGRCEETKEIKMRRKAVEASKGGGERRKR